ncbi:MAG: type II toxin-antitoxin system VapC family toxin [Bryobacteraceae bacterium]
MTVLVDTHAFLWWITDNSRLPAHARSCFTERRNQLFLSVASLWEIIVKTQIGRLAIPRPAGPYLVQQMARNALRVLPLQPGHVFRLENLPMHHRDPFDRILVAQSQEEGWPVLTGDPLIRAYDVQTIW